MLTLTRTTCLIGLAFLTLSSLASIAYPSYPTPTTLVPPSGRPVPQIVQQWADAWNRGDAQGMVALFTDDGVYQDFAFQVKNQGKVAVAGWVTLTVKNITKARAVILDAFQTGDRAAVQWIFEGTPLQLGPLKGTGRSFAVPATSIFEIKNGRIASVIDYYNRADLFHQLGLPSDSWMTSKP